MQEIITRSPGWNAVTAGADFFDDADALMPQDAPGRTGGNIAFQDMQIGAADRRLDDPDDGVRRRGDLGLRTICNGLLAWSLINECFHGWLLLGAA